MRWFLAAMALGAGLQVGTPDSSAPAAIEQALIEYACGATRAAGPESEAYQVCLSSQLLLLRTSFGRDLGRLSASERKTLDAACSTARERQGREAYVACLSSQLATLSRRRNRATPAPSAEPALPSPSASVPDSPESPARQASAWSSGVWIGAAAATGLVAAAGGVLFAMKRRPAPATCRVCGGDAPAPGALCQKCRHDAAEAIRHAAAERADQQRAQEEEQRRQREQEEELRRQKARQAEEDEAHRRQQEEARGREEEARQQREETRQFSQAATAPDDVFDPYAVLGVPRDASQEAIRAAYQEAKAKYDVDQVAHLGVDLQDHFKAKAQAADLAYQKLTEKP